MSFGVCQGHATGPVRLVAKFFSAPGPRLMLPIHFRGGVHPSEAGSSLNTEKLRLSPCLRATNCCHLNVTELTTRSEAHTSELQSLMRISYAVFCLKKKKTNMMKTRVRQ